MVVAGDVISIAGGAHDVSRTIASAAHDGNAAHEEMEVLVGWQNEREAARKALDFLQSDTPAVRNAAAAMLSALLSSGNLNNGPHGARQVLLEGNTLQTLLTNEASRDICLKAFAADTQVLDVCWQVMNNRHSSVLARRVATESIDGLVGGGGGGGGGDGQRHEQGSGLAAGGVEGCRCRSF